MNHSGPDSKRTESGSPNYFTKLRLELDAWLMKEAPSLRELYAGSLRMIYESPVMQGRVRFISHAVREIRNRLPEYVSGVKGDGPVNYKGELDALATRWHRTASGAGDSMAGTGVVPATSAVSIPSDVYERISQLIQRHILARERPRQAAGRLFETLLPENQSARANMLPQLDQWIRVTQWFAGQAHDNGKSDDDYKWDDFVKRFDLFEVSLASLIRGFFHTTESLDEILESANS